MVGTPADVSLFSKAYGLVRNYSARIFAIGKRITTMEERVTELEAKLSKQPADACPFCGERAMRKTHDGMIKGGAPNQWKEDIWTCQDCNKTEKRVTKFR